MMTKVAISIPLLLLLATPSLMRGTRSSDITLPHCCPDFWTQVGYNCYKTSPGPLTWFDAEQFCSLEGGHLIEIRQEHDQAMFWKLLQSDTLYWIGLTDLADEGIYVWQTDFKETNFTFWQRPQPDNAGDNEDCVHLTNDNFQWNDRNCEHASVISQSGKVTNIHALCEKNIYP